MHRRSFAVPVAIIAAGLMTLCAPSAFTQPGGRASLWPNDGIVNTSSAFAAAASGRVMAPGPARLRPLARFRTAT